MGKIASPPGRSGEIVAWAAHTQADLIVMATHGYGGFRRWALGSVADTVLHTTTTPLLLVRAQNRSA
jgi:nucleotide-binding universal stress UspA family protein